MASQFEQRLTRLAYVKYSDQIGFLGKGREEMGIVWRGGKTEKWWRLRHLLLGGGWREIARTCSYWRGPSQFRTQKKKDKDDWLTFRIPLLGWLIDDCGVLETPKVKHSDTTIGTARNEDIHAICTKPHIEDLFVMCNELGLCGQCRNVPYRARGINAGGDD